MPPTINAASQGPNDSSGSNPGPDQKLLDRIRHRFTYMVQAWKDIRDEAELDMRAQSTDGPWDPAEREARKTAKRPCIHLDQLNQYTNNLINEVRLNPIAVKVSPDDAGTDKDTADLSANRIRAIEYESNAQQAYLCAFENAATRSYGAVGLQLVYKSWDSFDQIVKVRRFANPDAVLWDPNCKEADSSDMEDAFVLDRIPTADFKRKYKHAATTDFAAAEIGNLTAWVNDDTVQIAEYWYIEKTPMRMFLLETAKGPQRVFSDELPKDFKVRRGVLTLPTGKTIKILDERWTEQPVVKQCLTNGIEILDETEWPGRWIPIFPALGREKWQKDGETTKRILESYIRHARDPQMLFDYYKTNEAEVVGMTPKTPYVGYVGQFETDADSWDELPKVPKPYVQVDPVVDAATNSVLPLPQRETSEPPIQALEVGAESARRSIQAALGSYGYTRLDDTNVKSGKAINMLDKQSDMGSFHFIDNYKTMLRHIGRAMEELLFKVENTARDVSVRYEDGRSESVRINEPYFDEKENKQKIRRYRLNEDGTHGVTIDTGPSYQSQREEATAFADALAQNPQVFPLIGDLVVKLKKLGPIGDQIADRLHKMLPPQLQDEEGQAQIPPQLQQVLQQYEHALNDSMQQLDLLKKEKDAKVLELNSRSEIEMARIDANKEIAAIDARLKEFQIQTQLKMKQLDLQAKGIIVHEELTSAEQMHVSQVEADQQILALEQEHERTIVAAQQQHAIETQQADQQHQMQQQQADQQHQQQTQATDQQFQQQQAQAVPAAE